MSAPLNQSLCLVRIEDAGLQPAFTGKFDQATAQNCGENSLFRNEKHDETVEGKLGADQILRDEPDHVQRIELSEGFDRVSKIVAWKIDDNHRDQHERSKEKTKLLIPGAMRSPSYVSICSIGWPRLAILAIAGRAPSLQIHLDLLG